MLVTQAEFSRMKGVSRKTVSEWKREGRIVIVDGMVDVERSQKKLLAASRHRATGRRAAVTLPPADGAKVTPALWNLSPPACGEHLSGEDYGALMAAQRLAEAAPAVLAVVADAIGLTASQAARLRPQVRVSMMETASLLLDAMAVPPPAGIRSWCDAPMWAGGGSRDKAARSRSHSRPPTELPVR